MTVASSENRPDDGQRPSANDAELDPISSDPTGPELANPDLPDQEFGELAADETEAEELLSVDLEDDRTPNIADPDEVVIDDPEQLAEAEAEADAAASPVNKPVSNRPVKRNQTVAPVKKSAPTRKQSDANKTVEKRTGPVEFVKQSVGELKKVHWPTANQTQQYFIVVLVFVLVLMAIVAAADGLFGWLAIKLLG